MLTAMHWTRSLPIASLFVSLASCSATDCQLPKEWKLASAMTSPTVPASTKVLFHAQETKAGHWLWYWGHRSTGTHEELLNELKLLSDFDPRPLFLFTFAEGHSCEELNALRAGIAQAARCSEVGEPCVDGTPDNLPF